MYMEVTVWEFPEELKPYRSEIVFTGGWEIEELMNGLYNDVNMRDINLYKYECAQNVAAQISLLKKLHLKRKLRDLSAWVCKTPYPESGKFCGSPKEHPVFWGCGYKLVDEIQETE